MYYHSSPIPLPLSCWCSHVAKAVLLGWSDSDDVASQFDIPVVSATTYWIIKLLWGAARCQIGVVTVLQRAWDVGRKRKWSEIAESGRTWCNKKQTFLLHFPALLGPEGKSQHVLDCVHLTHDRALELLHLLVLLALRVGMSIINLWVLVGWSVGILVGIVTHRSRSLIGTGNYRSGSEVHNCQVLVTGTCKIW